MAEQGRSAQYPSATQVSHSASPPNESTTDTHTRPTREEQLEAARRNEIVILTQLRHENIVGYTKGLDGHVELEKLDATLEQKLKEQQQMTLFQKLVVMKHIAQALTYLHGLARPLLHLNVQPSSIQLGSKAGIIAKLCEFRVAGFADELSQTATIQTEHDNDNASTQSTSQTVSTTSSSPSSPASSSPSSSSSSTVTSPNDEDMSSVTSTDSCSGTTIVGASAPTKPPAPIKTPTPEILSGMRGAPLYNPPEAFQGEPYTTASDVYSFGLTMSELICGGSPFASVRSLAGLVHAMQQTPVFPEDLPTLVADLLGRCRHQEPSKRPRFSEILAAINDWFVPIFVHENINWARQFWLEHFPQAISVRWSEFVGCLIRALKLPTTPNDITFRGVQKSKENAHGIATRRLHCLKQLFFPGLAEDTDFMRSINLWIDIDKYGHIMGTFSDENTNLENFLEGLANLIETRWFHGDATGSSGPHRLSPDTFLIRLSAPAQNSLKPPNCWFTFSLKTSAGDFVRETRIQRTPGRSECILANSQREVFSSLYALVETKGKPYGLAPIPSFLQSTLHPVSAEYTTDDEEND